MSEEGRFATSGWSADGIAMLEARGSDARAALEAGLRAVLELAGGPGAGAGERAAPMHGEGADLASVFEDLVEGLFAALDDAAIGPSAVALDGVLRRDDGGYRAWGYAFGDAVPPGVTRALPQIVDVNIRQDESAGIVLRARLRRR